MKRILSLLLALTLVFTCVSSVHAEAEDVEPVKVRVQVYSNLNGRRGVAGLYLDNAFYVKPNVICSLANGELSQLSRDSATFSFFDGLMSVTVGAGDKTIPTLTYNNQLYISVVHFLRHMGFGVSFGEGAEDDTHMLVYRQYTVMDALGEYVNNGSRFSWAEADGVGDLTRVLSGLDTVLLGYDPNIFRYFTGAFGVDSVEKEIDIDVLRLILESWNPEHLSGDDPMLSVLNASTALSSIYFDTVGWYGYLENAVGKNAISEIGVLNDALGVTVFDAAGGVIGVAADQAEAMDLFKQFANMTGLSEKILSESLGRIDDSSSFYKQRPELFKAVEDVTKMFDGSYRPDLLEDIFSNAWKTGMSVAGGIAATTWSMVATLLQNNETVQTVLSKEKGVTYAGGCTNIEIIANSMVKETYGRISGSAEPAAALSDGAQEQLKAQMAMSLKASLVAREQLLGTGWIEDNAAAEMERACRINAEQLNRVINAEPLELNVTPEVTEDLSWIAQLTAGEIYGHAVEYGGDVYYWKYNGDSYESYGNLSYLPLISRTVNQMVRRSGDGTETVLFEANGNRKIAVANGRIYYQTFDGIWAWDMDTGEVTALGKGNIEGATEDGNCLICSGDNNLDTVDTETAQRVRLVEDAGYIACWDGVIYYKPVEEDYNAAHRGRMTVARILPDGSEQAVLHTTEADLYGDGDMVSPPQVGQMYFGEEYIYFSYGGIAGSGIFYQGGKIIRMRYDGSEAEVVAGAKGRVGADFTVNADGTVNAATGDAAYTALFSSMNEYYFSNGVGYRYDRTNGEREEIISAGDYSAVGPGLAGYAGDESVLINQIQVTDSRVYFLAHALVRDGVMWRAEYARRNSAFMMKDMETGAVEVLYTF